MGLFASRAIAAGELVTFYPGDALVIYAADGGDRSLVNVGESSSEAWRAGWQSQAAQFVKDAASYRVRWADRAIIGDPSSIADKAYLGHMANDAAMCTCPGTTTTAYARASEAAANIALDSASMFGCHHAVVATRVIEAGEELFISYGIAYWLGRLPEPPQRYSFPDGSTYYGEVAGGEIAGHGEFSDAVGNRYVGEFVAGRYEGVGTFFYADGRTEASRFAAGEQVGEVVGWAADHMEAYRLVAAVGDETTRRVRETISLEEAAKIAEPLGVPLPAIP